MICVGDALYVHDGMKFSAYDNDEDAAPARNCAKERGGGFWYNDCVADMAYPTGNHIQWTTLNDDIGYIIFFIWREEIGA